MATPEETEELELLVRDYPEETAKILRDLGYHVMKPTVWRESRRPIETIEIEGSNAVE